jgi:hypothetical protein
MEFRHERAALTAEEVLVEVEEPVAMVARWCPAEVQAGRYRRGG